MKLPRLKSITIAIAFQFTLLAAVALFVMGIVIRDSVDRHFAEQDYAVISGKQELIRHILLKATTAADISNIRQQLNDALIGHHDLLVRIDLSSGMQLIATGSTSIPDPVFSATLRSIAQPRKIQWSDNGVAYRGLASLVVSNENTMTWGVVVAVDTQHHAEFLRAFERELALTGLLGVLLIACLGWLASRRGLKPVQAMAQVAERISAQRLHERLAMQDVATELEPLARAFNEMLDRLGDSLNRLSDFSSDLAHELRTPINNLMTQTQVSVSKLRTANEYREVLYSNLEEFERLARMIEDMLFIAKADHGLVIPRREAVDLNNEVSAVFEFYDALAAEKSISLKSAGSASVEGDPLMLRRAISNLLSNAIRHARAGTTVQVCLEQTPTGFTLSVENSGDTIPPEQLARLFDRFFRADTSRQRNEEGAGLGLAITRSIVHAHHGKIAVTSQGDRTRFLIALPLRENHKKPLDSIKNS